MVGGSNFFHVLNDVVIVLLENSGKLTFWNLESCPSNFEYPRIIANQTSKMLNNPVQLPINPKDVKYSRTIANQSPKDANLGALEILLGDRCCTLSTFSKEAIFRLSISARQVTRLRRKTNRCYILRTRHRERLCFAGRNAFTP